MTASGTVVDKVLVPISVEAQEVLVRACAKKLVESGTKSVHTLVGHAQKVSANACESRFLN